MGGRGNLFSLDRKGMECQWKRTRSPIVEMARGAILERINYEMARVMDNILDANTKPTAKRKLTVTLTFTPDDERQRLPSMW